MEKKWRDLHPAMSRKWLNLILRWIYIYIVVTNACRGPQNKGKKSFQEISKPDHGFAAWGVQSYHHIITNIYRDASRVGLAMIQTVLPCLYYEFEVQDIFLLYHLNPRGDFSGRWKLIPRSLVGKILSFLRISLRAERVTNIQNETLFTHKCDKE